MAARTPALHVANLRAERKADKAGKESPARRMSAQMVDDAGKENPARQERRKRGQMRSDEAGKENPAGSNRRGTRQGGGADKLRGATPPPSLLAPPLRLASVTGDKATEDSGGRAGKHLRLRHETTCVRMYAAAYGAFFPPRWASNFGPLLPWRLIGKTFAPSSHGASEEGERKTGKRRRSTSHTVHGRGNACQNLAGSFSGGGERCDAGPTKRPPLNPQSVGRGESDAKNVGK